MDEEIQKALDAKFKAVQDELAAAQKNNATKEEITKITEAIKTQGQALEDFMEAQKAVVIKDTLAQFEAFLAISKEELAGIQKNKTGVIEFIPKAVGAVTTGNGTTPTTLPANYTTDLGSFNLRNDNNMLDLATVTSTNNPVHVYTEMVPKDGNYAMVAEGGVKPQIDFNWINRHATPRKAAAHEVLTEEAVTDIPRLMSVAKEYLKKKHDLFKVDRVFFGDGLLENPKGATVYGRAFVAGAMALKFPAGTANFMDVVNAIIADIFTTHNFIDESPYVANVVLINPIDFFLQFQAAKDANGLPLYPQASLFNTVTVGGVTIRPWYKIPTGKIFVADMSKYNISNYIPFSIRIGWINDQFITNQFTMVGESRFFAYVKNFDQQAFVYTDIATVKTAISAL